MQRLDLDFQKTPTTWPLPGIAVLILGIGLTAFVLDHYVETSDALTRSESRVARLKRDVERQQLFATRTGNSTTNANAITQKGRSRERSESLFSGLETAADETVTLLSFESGATEISLRAEAQDFAAMTAYIHRLASVPVLADVRLTEHEIARDHPRRPLRFTVKANEKAALR